MRSRRWSRCTGQIVCCGVGKSGHVAAKIAATLSSTGTPASFLSAAEAVHGDLGGLRKGDIVLAVSHSGENPELLAVLPLFKRFECRSDRDHRQREFDALARRRTSSLLPGTTAAADPIGLAPTASTAAALAIGDALALAIAQHRGYSVADFEHHPGGALGQADGVGLQSGRRHALGRRDFRDRHRHIARVAQRRQRR